MKHTCVAKFEVSFISLECLDTIQMDCWFFSVCEKQQNTFTTLHYL